MAENKYQTVEVNREFLNKIRKKYPQQTRNMTDGTIVNWVLSEQLITKK
jgi:hypothetical protein